MQNGSAPGRPPAAPQRFVPSGIDARSWMGFEQRIQERRFNALLETMRAAIAVGDAAGARAALDEARELKPTALELDAYDLRIRSIPMAAASGGRLRVGRWRAVSAVAMLLGGVAFVTGTDYLRSQPTGPTAVPVDTFGMVPPAADQYSGPTVGMTASRLPSDGNRVDTRTAGRGEWALPEGPLATAGRAAEDEGEEVAISESPRPVVTEEIPPFPQEPPSGFVYPTVEEPAPSPVPARVPPLRSSTAAPPPAASPTAAPGPTPNAEAGRVTDTLNAYARAYGQLDASAARAVWPTVNERALARAFASLESQRVSFDECQIELNGATASASCRGQASYVGKVGSREPRTESREWHFQLRRDGQEWRIANAEARRR